MSTDYATSLDDHLDTVIAPTADDRFTVTDDSSGEWAARKLARAHARLDDIAATADQQIDAINQWRLDVSAGPQRDVDYFSGLLTDWLRRVTKDDPTVKSIKLPSAWVKSRAGRATVAVEDQAAFIKWAEANAPDTYTTTVKPDKRTLAKFPTDDEGHLVHPDTGEVVPGVGVVAGQTSYTVEVR